MAVKEKETKMYYSWLLVPTTVENQVWDFLKLLRVTQGGRYIGSDVRFYRVWKENDLGEEVDTDEIYFTVKIQALKEETLNSIKEEIYSGSRKEIDGKVRKTTIFSKKPVWGGVYSIKTHTYLTRSALNYIREQENVSEIDFEVYQNQVVYMKTNSDGTRSLVSDSVYLMNFIKKATLDKIL